MIFGEPTYNEILIGCKGLLVCDAYFKEKKAPSSNPDKGISANLNAVRFLYELEQFYLMNIKNEINEHIEKQSYDRLVMQYKELIAKKCL